MCSYSLLCSYNTVFQLVIILHYIIPYILYLLVMNRIIAVSKFKLGMNTYLNNIELSIEMSPILNCKAN